MKNESRYFSNEIALSIFCTKSKILHCILVHCLTEWITVLRHIMFYYSSFLLCLLNWQKRAIENLRIEKFSFLCGIIFSSLAVELIWPVTQMRELTKKSIWDIKKNDRRVSVTNGCVSGKIIQIYSDSILYVFSVTEGLFWLE